MMNEGVDYRVIRKITIVACAGPIPLTGIG